VRKRPVVVCRMIPMHDNGGQKPVRVLNSSFLEQGVARDKEILSAAIVLNWKLPKLTIQTLEHGVCIYLRNVMNACS